MTAFNVLNFDSKLTYRRLIGHVPELLVLLFKHFLFNPLAIPGNWMDPRDFVFLWAKVFTRDNLLSIPSENVLATALTRLFTEREIFSGSKNFPTMRDLYRTLVKMQSENTLGYHYRDIFDACKNRIMIYCKIDSLNCKIGINFDLFFHFHIVIEVPLVRISDYVHNYLVSWITTLIYYRNNVLGLRGNELRTLVIIDEASTILSASRESGPLDFIEPSLNQIITKGREFGIGLVLCSQRAGSFNQDYKSNSSLKISLALNSDEDRTAMQRDFGLTDEMKAFSYQLPAQQVAICRYALFPRPFLLRVPDMPSVDHVPSDQEVEEAMKDFYEKNLPKKESAMEIRDAEPETVPLSPEAVDGLIMVKHLIKEPFLNYKELISELNLTPARGDKARTWLVNNGYIEIHSIVLRRGKPGEYFELADKVFKKFHAQPPAGKGNFEHKGFSHFIKLYAEANGFGARVEGFMEGTDKPIDVLTWKKGVGMVGYEVTLHFSNLQYNVRQDLKTTLKNVIIVCRNKDELAKAQKIIREGGLPTYRLEFKTIFEFTEREK